MVIDHVFCDTRFGMEKGAFTQQYAIPKWWNNIGYVCPALWDFGLGLERMVKPQ
jgi:hypothetical protein